MRREWRHSPCGDAAERMRYLVRRVRGASSSGGTDVGACSTTDGDGGPAGGQRADRRAAGRDQPGLAAGRRQHRATPCTTCRRASSVPAWRSSVGTGTRRIPARRCHRPSSLRVGSSPSIRGTSSSAFDAGTGKRIWQVDLTAMKTRTTTSCRAASPTMAAASSSPPASARSSPSMPQAARRSGVATSACRCTRRPRWRTAASSSSPSRTSCAR